MYKLTWPEVEAYLKENDLIILPVGSTEQHGRHMAEDNDTFTALEVAKRVAEKTGVLVAPAIPFGYSTHHMRFPGTITLTFETLVRVYKEVCKSLLHHGFKKIVIFNGHGGNSNPIAQAIREIREETGAIIHSLMVFPMERGFGSASLKILEQEGGGHACELETSIGLYLGQRILFNKAEKWKPPRSQREFERKYQGKVVTARNFDEITESGSLGEPTIATKEKGEKLVETMVEEISVFIEELKKVKI
ncbi:creatininase family protein [Candidatus Bathyarchaeota archaeon]|nr:creatininase family protein [Candidatus Bathyarchaeota archaeon]